MQPRRLSLSGRSDIRTAANTLAWSVRVRLVAWGKTIDLSAAHGRTAARLRRRVLSFPGTRDLHRADGGEDAVIRRNMRVPG